MRKSFLFAVLLLIAALVLFGCTQPYGTNTNPGATAPNTQTQTIQNSTQPDYNPQPATQAPAPPAPQPLPPPTQANTAPIVVSGSNQVIDLPNNATLSGSATDDGLPNGTLIYSWGVDSASSERGVTFSNPSQPSTTATFSKTGTYILKLTVYDGQLSGSSITTITVNPAKQQQSPSPVAITIQNYSFSPNSITVPVGTTVTWTNMDSPSHTVTENNNVFNSGDLSTGQKFSHTFTTTGTYNYHCGIHPSMKATIIVQ